jgi:alkylation response protein AidB-like acyl-CoA dehydrogenase
MSDVARHDSESRLDRAARVEREDALDRVIAEVVAPAAEQVDREGRFPRASIDALGRAGFLALTVPRENGGIGASAAEFARAVTRLATACASTAMVYVMHATALSSIVLLADEEQRREFLTPVLEGRWLVTEAISEPGSGSQWWSVASTSEQTPDGYRIDADKSFATSSGHADLYIVSTRAPGSDGDRDHALFMVRGTAEGITTGTWKGLGLAGNSSTGFSFHGGVDRAALLTRDRQDGLRRYNEVNQPLYHLGFAAAYLGVSTAAYEAAVGRVRSRTYPQGTSAYGTSLSAYPVARRHVGEMAIRIASVRALVASLAGAIDAGASLEEMAVEMTAAKVAAAEAAVDVARQAMTASGGGAYIKGLLTIERHLRDALAASLMGPNDDFCKELIGRLVLEGGSYHDL